MVLSKSWIVAVALVSACADVELETEESTDTAGLQKLTGTPKAPCNRTDTPCVDMYIGAHPDDDLLFMNPDIINSIRSGNRVIVIVKNGGYREYNDDERIEEPRYWLNRERGILNAYAYMARGDAATISNNATISQNGRTIPAGFTPVISPGETDAYAVLWDPLQPPLRLPRFDIQATGGNLVTVMFLRVQDAATAALWLEPGATRPIRQCPPIAGSTQDACAGGEALGEQNVNRASLLGFYRHLMQEFAVTSVSILDATDINVELFGDPGQYEGFSDNWEHVYTAKFALAAAAQVQATTNRPISIRSSRGYTLDLEEPNLATADPEVFEKQRAFLYYAMFDQAALWPSVGNGPWEYCGGSGQPPCSMPDPNRPYTQPAGATTTNRMTGVIPFLTGGNYFTDPDSHVYPALYGAQNWQSKKFTTRTLVGTEPLRGRIQNGNGSCLTASTTAASFVSCSSAPQWTLTTDNRIQTTIGGANYCLTVALAPNPPSPSAESVSVAPCGAMNGSQTMFVFSNGQIRTPQARCLGVAGSLASEDCRPAYVTVPRVNVGASSTEGSFSPWYAIDGSMATRWSSAFSDSQWLVVQLDAETTVRRIRLAWETAYGRDYDIQLSTDGYSYTTCDGCQVRNGDGGVDEIVLTTPTPARYVRMYGIRRGTQWGYSLWDIAVNRPSGTPTPTQDWTLLFDPIQFSTTQWSNSSSVDNYDFYYRTLTIVNRNICLRWWDGNYCAPWTSGLSVDTATRLQTDFANAYGWGVSENGSTVRSVWSGADPGGSTIACGRGYYGVGCTNGLWVSDFATTSGWNAPQYYETIRYPDLFGDGNVHVCGRGYYGIHCALNQGGWWSPASLLTEQFSSYSGWSDPSNAVTIQFGDVNGDGRLDVCGREDQGIRCAVMTNDSAVFINGRYWSYDTDRTTGVRRDFADNDPVVNWAINRAYYGSIRLVDINRDGLADVCGRGPAGLYCAFSNGTGFEAKRLVLPDLNDVSGWGVDNTGGTLSFGDLNGNKRMDLCARGIGGVWCAEGY